MANAIKDRLEVGTPGLEDQGHEGRLVKEMETKRPGRYDRDKGNVGIW